MNKDKGIDIEKINDFIDIYSNTLDLSEEHSNILRELIPSLVEKYKDISPNITTQQDDYDKYVIKPKNGEYSMEDFFLNRLMRNVWGVESTLTASSKGNYDSTTKKIEFNEEKIKRQLSKVLDTSRKDFDELDSNARKKVKMHEFEHSLQTRFDKGVPNYFLKAHYSKLIEQIKSFKGGKYANEIISIEEIEKLNSPQKAENCLTSGIHCTSEYKPKHGDTYRDLINGEDNLNEIFNETEALEMAKCEKMQTARLYEDGSYYPIRNEESSNSDITNYGNLLKTLIGEKETFIGMYFEPDRMFKIFNERYDDIFQKDFGNHKSAWANVVEQINQIKATNRQENHLKLQTTLAKCLEKRIDKTIDEKDAKALAKDVMSFRENCIWSKDKNVRDNLEHCQILGSLKERIEEKAKQENKIGEQHKEKDETIKDDKKELPVQEKKNGRVSFEQGLMTAYERTETEYQYEQRKNDEHFDMERVQKIIDTKGRNRMLTDDLDGKWIGTPDDEDFKIEYSQKQVSAMARLLKAADLLTKNKQLNPKGRNYLEEFSKIPNIDNILKEMEKGVNDKDSYIYQIRQEAIENAKNNQLPNFPKTEGEEQAEQFSNSNEQQENKKTFDMNSLKKSIRTSDVRMAEVKTDQLTMKDQIHDRENGITIDSKESENERG